MSAIGRRAVLPNCCLFVPSVIGDGVFIATFATLYGLDLAGGARVRVGESLADVSGPFVGCPVGRQVLKGAGVAAAAGRKVPSGVRLVSGGGAVTRINSDATPGDCTEGEWRMDRGGSPSSDRHRWPRPAMFACEQHGLVRT